MGVLNEHSRKLHIRLDARDPDEKRIIDKYESMLSGRKNDYLRRILINGDKLEAGIVDQTPQAIKSTANAPSLFKAKDEIASDAYINDSKTEQKHDENNENETKASVSLAGLFGSQD